MLQVRRYRVVILRADVAISPLSSGDIATVGCSLVIGILGVVMTTGVAGLHK